MAKKYNAGEMKQWTQEIRGGVRFPTGSIVCEPKARA